MAKVSHREKVLLGYSSSNSMSNSSSRRNSEVDFSDVFGGPPRCSSTQEYYNYNEIDDNDRIDDDDDDDDDDDADSAWFGLREKPVFGEQVVARRRYTSEDFYGDIFGGDQPLLSGSSSPRVHMPGRNPFSSAPGSRTMSPSRPLPPASDLTQPLSKLSLPGRTANTEILTSTSMSQSSKSSRRSLTRFNQTVQNHSSQHGDAKSLNRPSTLSRQISVDGNELTSDLKLDGAEYEGEVVMDSKGSETQNEKIQFHFSIYKWGSKGVPITLSSRKRSPSRPKERVTNERYLSTSEGIGNAYLVMQNSKGDVILNDSISSSKRRMPSTALAKEGDGNNGDTIVRSMSADCKTENDTSSIMLDDATQKVGEAPSDGLEDAIKVSDLLQKSLDAVEDDNSLKDSPKITKSNMRTLSSLFREDRKGKKNTIADIGGKKNKYNEAKKPAIEDDISSDKVNKSKVQKSSTGAKQNDDISSNKVNKSKVHKSSTGAKDDGGKGGNAAGKVKDFVKKFNQDPTPKAKSDVTGKSRSWRWKNTTTVEAETEVKTFEAKEYDEIQASFVNLEKTWSETIEVVDGESFLSGEHYTINDTDNVSATRPTTTSASNNEPNVDGSKASAPKSNATINDGSQDKEMVQDIDMQLAIESQEETQSYELKVRQWSKGKEGNIRALLSTMQFVLWPNSGWKPIPLVDIIEANSVKKAYQRALLCLHPDKLQQKGAAAHQKFIAEKVFDILQEAWDQFNTIGLLS